jgi:hypothetical protein
MQRKAADFEGESTIPMHSSTAFKEGGLPDVSIPTLDFHAVPVTQVHKNCQERFKAWQTQGQFTAVVVVQKKWSVRDKKKMFFIVAILRHFRGLYEGRKPFILAPHRHGWLSRANWKKRRIRPPDCCSLADYVFGHSTVKWDGGERGKESVW